MLGDQQREIGVLRFALRILKAVAVHGDDAVGVLVHHDAVGVHAEGAHLVLEFSGAVNDLAFVQFVGQVGKDDRGQFHPHADIHPVGGSGDVQLAAGLFHPLAPASSHGDDAFPAVGTAALKMHPERPVKHLHGFCGSVEAEFHPVLHFIEKGSEDHVIPVGPQVAHRGVQQGEPVLQAQLFEGGARRGILFRAGAAMGHVDPVHVLHQLQGLFPADVAVQRAAEIVGDVVFAVGEGPGPAEAVHNGAFFAADTGFDPLPVDGANPLFQRAAAFQHQDLPVRAELHQLISRINAAGASPDNDHIVHGTFPHSRDAPKAARE